MAGQTLKIRFNPAKNTEVVPDRPSAADPMLWTVSSETSKTFLILSPCLLLILLGAFLLIRDRLRRLRS
jgi:hypothetical protein